MAREFMTLESAKKFKGYRFVLNGIEDIITEIRNGHLESFNMSQEPMRGAAVMEIGYVDIEMNVFTEAQVTTLKEKENDLSPVIDYFICVKTPDEEWVSVGYLDRPVDVNWNSSDWREQLESDMFSALDEYVSSTGYHYARGNFVPSPGE